MRPSHGVSLFRTPLLVFAVGLCMFPQAAQAQAPVIDGNLTDLISYVRQIQQNGGGCGLEISDPDSDVVLTQPFSPCSPIEPVPGGQYFVNGYDQNLGLIVFDGSNLYLGIQTVGQVGDPDGNGNPDTDCNTNIIDNPGIGQFESYKWFIDGDCDGNPEILITLNNNTVGVSGVSNSGTSFAFNGTGVEVLVEGVDLVPQFVGRTFAGSDVDGLSEDLTQEVQCPPMIPTVSISKSVEDVCAGGTTVVSINVENTSAVALDPVVITDQLPAGFTFAGNVTGIGAPNVVGGVATFPNIILQPNETRAITFQIQAPGGCSGVHSNSASVSGVFTHPCNPEANHAREAVSQTSAQFECLQLQVTVENGSTCAGGTDELCAQVTGGAGPYTYSWTGPGGFTSGQQCITVGTTGSYTVTVTDSQGCTGMGTGQLTLIPGPTCTINGPDPVCTNTTGHSYTATVLPAGGTVTYAWSISGQGTIVGSTTASSVNVNAGSTGSFTLTLNVTRDGCAGTCTKTVTVSPGLSVSVGNVVVCAGATAQLCAVVTGGTPPYTYSWTGPGGFQGTGECVNVSTPGAYTVVVTSTAGCTGTGSATVTVETPDVDIIKTAVPTQTEDDSQVTIVVENTGASALSPVRVTDLLPPGLSFDAGSLQSDCNVTATTESMPREPRSRSRPSISNPARPARSRTPRTVWSSTMRSGSIPPRSSRGAKAWTARIPGTWIWP